MFEFKVKIITVLVTLGISSNVLARSHECPYNMPNINEQSSLSHVTQSCYSERIQCGYNIKRIIAVEDKDATFPDNCCQKKDDECGNKGGVKNAGKGGSWHR